MDHRDDISAAIKDIRDEIRCYERWSDSAKRQLRQLIRRASEVANYTDE